MNQYLHDSRDCDASNVIRRILNDSKYNKQITARKVQELYSHYRTLEDIYKQEHLKVLHLMDKIFLIENGSTTNEVAEEKIKELQEAIEQQKEEFKVKATKLGQGRKAIEDKLIEKENELQQYKMLKNENDRLREENASLVTLANYYKGLVPPAILQQQQQQGLL